MKTRLSRVAMAAALTLLYGVPLTTRADASDVVLQVFACLAGGTPPGPCLAATLPPPPPPPSGPGHCGPTGGGRFPPFSPRGGGLSPPSGVVFLLKRKKPP